MEVKGIQAYRFAPPRDVLMSPKDNPTNEGFCVPAGDCLGTGVLKVSVCREGKGLAHFPPLSPKSLTLFPLMTSKPAPPPTSMSTPQKCPFSQQPRPLPGIWHSQCLSMLDFTQYMVQWLTVLIVSVEAIEVFYGGHCVWLLWYGNHHRAWHMRTVYHWQIL